jgi:hypothetical protein
MFVSSPIDVDAWDKAGWVGTAFLHELTGALVLGLGLVFKDEAAGRKIFTGWRARFGEADADEYVRVAIIEGDVPGRELGYFVVVGAEPKVVAARARAAGLADPGETLLACWAVRHHRMEPPPGSPNLSRLKEAYARRGEYQLLPLFVEGGGLAAAPDLAIRKKRVHFRTVEEVGPNDADRVCFGPPRDRPGDN